MAKKGEVDLVIRAKNEATKNLDAVNKALKSLSDQQTIVGDSAGQMDGQLGKLGVQLAQLQTNAQNLKSLASIKDVLDGATQAMFRQRAASAETAQEYDKLAVKQKALSDESAKVGEAVKSAAEEFAKQDSALKSIKGTFSDITKENKALVDQEERLAKSLARSVTSIQGYEAALAKEKQTLAEKVVAIEAVDKATKVQTNSLAASERAVARRQAKLDEAVAAEKAYRAQLVDVKKALEESTAPALNLNAAVAAQAAKTDAAKTALAGYNEQAKGLAKAQRSISVEMEKSASAVAAQADALNEAETEYRELQAVADQAKTAVSAQAKTVERSGDAAAKAAAQVAIFTARMAVLQKGAGDTTVRIVDPAEALAASKALKDLGATIKAAGTDASESAVSAEELSVALKGVGEAKNKIEGIGLALKAQREDVDIAKNAWDTAQAEVRRLAVAMKSAGQPSEELTKALGRAQGAARLAKDEFIKQSKASEQTGAALKAAGIGAGDLASAEAALGPVLQKANALMSQGARASEQLNASNEKMAQSASRATRQLNGLRVGVLGLVTASNKLGRATNPLRLFTTQLGAMVTAGVGLYGIKKQLEDIWEAGSNLASSEAKFATAFGGIEEGAKELEYAREVAVNLKLPLGDLTKGYADLALSAKGTSLEGEGARKVFEAFAQTARANQSSAADLDGVFKALSQIMSKGKVQAEELRGQLGDRLPGALQIMADGLDLPMDKLTKMMEQGELTSDTLLAMASEASRRVAPALESALDTPAAKLADFQNRLLIFRETIAGSGFLDALADAFERMADALSQPEALDAARQLGVALGDIITWSSELVTSGNLETIGTAIAGLAVAWASVQAIGLVSGLAALAKGIGAVTVGVTGMTTALSPLLIGLGVLSGAVVAIVALFGAWKLAKWAYENFPAFGEGALKARTMVLNAFDRIVTGVTKALSGLTQKFLEFATFIPRTIIGVLSSVLGFVNRFFEAVGLDSIAEKAKASLDGLTAKAEALQQKGVDFRNGLEDGYAARARERELKLQKDLAAYREKYAEKPDGVSRPNPAAEDPKKKSGVGLARITDEGGAERLRAGQAAAQAEKDAKKAATARIALEKSVANQMFTIRSQLEKKSAQTVDEMVAAVPAKYAKLYEQLTKLGKTSTSEDWKAVDALVAQEQQLIRNTEAKKAATAAAKAERAAEAAETKSRKEGMEVVNTLLRTRKNIQEQLDRAKKDGDTAAVETLKANLAETTTKANEAIEGMLVFWRAVGGPDADAAISKLETMALSLTKVKEEGVVTGQTLANAFTGNLTSGIDDFVSKIAETGDIIGSLKEAFRQFAIDFLKQIAQMIMQQLILNAISGALGGATSGASAGSVGGMIGGMFHNGGVVGSGNQTRSNVNPAIFANAVRYHGGGVAGLRSNEVPAILEAGETVRTTEQEKALAAKQAASAGSGGGGTPIKIINQIDSGEMVASGIGSAAGEKAIINAISTNRDTIKRVLG